MLYTDGMFVTSTVLAAADNDAVNVAVKERINLDQVLRTTISECGGEILSRFQSIGRSGLTADHLYAVYGNDAFATRARLAQVIVTSGTRGLASSVQAWVLYSALVNLYTDAFSSRSSEAYEGRISAHSAKVSAQWKLLCANGVPIISLPLSAPGALFETSGSWTRSNVSAVDGAGGLQAQTYQIAVTYTGATYQSQVLKNNSESGPGEVLLLTVPASKVVRVDITSLVPPTGTDELRQPRMAATGWNVYIGQNDVLYLQNAAPVPIATKVYTLEGVPTVGGFQLGNGQIPDSQMTLMRTINRA